VKAVNFVLIVARVEKDFIAKESEKVEKASNAPSRVHVISLNLIKQSFHPIKRAKKTLYYGDTVTLASYVTYSPTNK